MTSKQHKKHRSSTVIVLTLMTVPFIMTLGNSMLIPILPMLERQLEITKLQTSLLITLYSIVAIVCIPIAGYLSDRYGRRVIIVPALVITAAGGLVAGLGATIFSKSYIIILAGRILQGIGASGAMPVVIPLVGDLFQEDERSSKVLGLIETSNTVGKVLSPIIGTAVALISWYMPFFLIPLLSAVSCILILLFIKDEKEQQINENFSQYTRKIRHVFAQHWRWLIAIFIAGIVMMYLLFGFLFYLSDLLEETFQFTGLIKGLLLAIPLTILATASFLSGRLVKDRHEMMKWISIGGLFLAGGTIVFSLFVSSYIFLMSIFSFTCLCIGFSLPAVDAMITNNLEKEIRGSVTSIYSAMRFIGVALGPVIAALLMKSYFPLFIGLFTVTCLISAFLLFICVNTNKDET